MNKVDDLRVRLLTIAQLGSALGLLGWDQEVNLPPKAHTWRGEVEALLAGEVHRRATAPEFVALVEQLADKSVFNKLNAGQQVIVRETMRDVRRAQKIPAQFVEKMARLTTKAFAAWVEARQKSDFSKFKPLLDEIIKLKRQQAELLGYKDSPYDALIEDFEPGMTAVRLESLFTPLAAHLSQLVKEAANKPVANLPRATYDVDKQVALNIEVATAIGYDFGAGRLDSSPHPFTTGFHPTDVRITTRYDEHDFWVALGATIHEVGHALYEQGLPEAEHGTPLGESVSLGVHESQSRIWENFVGRSQPFAHFLHPLLVKHFGKSAIKFSEEELYKWLNRVEPSLIRVEADEVTYNLHIVLRFELEKALIEGGLKTTDLPAAWNQEMGDYLGVKVPNDAHGVLQDVHWSHGSFGYFPTYSLGNLYSAQLFNKATKDIPGLEQGFGSGKFSPFLKWLRKEIHVQGRRYHAEKLIEKVTGEKLNSKYLLTHLESKIDP